MAVPVLVVDDQEPFRLAAAAVVAAADGFQVVGSAASGNAFAVIRDPCLALPTPVGCQVVKHHLAPESEATVVAPYASQSVLHIRNHSRRSPT
jgi:hypothetical protein